MMLKVRSFPAGAATASLLLCAAWIAPGCTRTPVPAPKAASPDTAVPVVQVARLKTGSITRTITLPAQVLPDQQVMLFAKVAGYLRSIAVDKGDAVKAGAVLAQIEVPELQSTRSRQQAELRAAEAEYGRLQQSLQRSPDLVVPLAVDQARGRMEIAKAGLEQSEAILRYATITAPFSGVVTQRFVDPGALVQSGSTSGVPLLTIMDFATVRLQSAVPEVEASRVAVGQPVTVTTDGLPGQKFEGRITRYAYALDPATRTMLAEVRLPNPRLLLRPGMLVTARIGIETRDGARLIPRDALVMEKTNAFVFVLAEGKASKRPIKVGFREGDSAEVLEGVGPEDALIIAAGRPLVDGSAVLQAKSP
jgi:membrane fusion protein, multidrug efflux system